MFSTVGVEIKKKRLFYTADDDLHILREVCGQNPYMEGSRWTAIRSHVKELTGKEFSVRSLKERVTLLVEKFQLKIKCDEYKSGIEDEVTEIDDLLHQILLLIEEFKKKPKSLFQNGYEKREQALQALQCEEESLKESTTEISVNRNEDFEVIEIEYHPEDESELIPAEPFIAIENQPITPTVVGNLGRGTITRGRGVRRGRGGVLTPARQRNNGIKQTSIRFLEVKNDRWYEIRKRELELEEKKFEFEKEERTKQIAFQEARLELEKTRLKAELDIFSNQKKIMDNQQKLMEIAFQARLGY